MFTSDDVIHSYTRAQAIEDGYLVDVSASAKEAGLKYPVAVTRAVWDAYVAFSPEDGEGQSIEGRLWDVVWMLRHAAANSAGSTLRFALYVAKADRGDWNPNEAVPEADTGLSRRTHRRVTLKAVCGPGDTAAPVITVMLPDED